MVVRTELSKKPVICGLFCVPVLTDDRDLEEVIEPQRVSCTDSGPLDRLHPSAGLSMELFSIF